MGSNTLEVTKIYLAGPMRGYTEFNFPLFAQATQALRNRHFEVFSPAERDLEVGFDPKKAFKAQSFSLKDAFLADFQAIIDADAVVFLPGWMRSEGCRAELVVATYTEKTLYRYRRPGGLIPFSPLIDITVVLKGWHLA